MVNGYKKNGSVLSFFLVPTYQKPGLCAWRDLMTSLSTTKGVTCTATGVHAWNIYDFWFPSLLLFTVCCADDGQEARNTLTTLAVCPQLRTFSYAHIG